MPLSRTIGRQIIVELPTGQKCLLIQVEVICPDCGYGLITISGHHLQALKRIIDEAITSYPDLTAVEDLTVLDRMSFSGRTPNDPKVN